MVDVTSRSASRRLSTRRKTNSPRRISPEVMPLGNGESVAIPKPSTMQQKRPQKWPARRTPMQLQLQEKHW